MKYALITFRSVTPAQKGESILRSVGYRCNMQRTPRWMEEQGCGYSLRIPLTDTQRCVQLLREKGMVFRKVYLLRENGDAEELEV